MSERYSRSARIAWGRLANALRPPALGSSLARVLLAGLVATLPLLVWLALNGEGRAVLWVERGTFRGHETQVLAVAFSPDGRWLATGDNGGGVRLWPYPALRRL